MLGRLLLPTLLWARAGGSEGNAEQPLVAAALRRDAQLEAPLQEQLLAPMDGDRAADLDARLQRAFVQCRALGATSLTYETTIDASAGAWAPLDADDVAYCTRLRYVRHQRQRARDVREALATPRHAGKSDTQVETRAADDVSFQEFFELYAEKARPVVLQLKEDAKDPVAQLLGLETSSNDAEEAAAAAASQSAMDKFLSVCFQKETKGRSGGGRIELRPMRVEQEACAAMLEATFRVPIYMTHDYVQRTNASRDEAFLPAIVELPPADKVEWNAPSSAKEVVACPYGLHMLAIPLGDVTVSIFDRKFEPILPPAAVRDQLREVVLGADATVATGSDGATVLDTDYFQRVPELYSAIELKASRDMLFAPGGVVSTMRSLSNAGRGKVLRFCYCDAANVKEVKQATGLDALLMTREGRYEGVYALEHALQHPGFDSTFSRRPTASDASWSTFVKWPRDPEYLVKKNRRHRINGDDQEGEEEQLSRRERLKQWQDDKRWERYIASLTLPVAWPPIVVNTTRTTATLRWQELYQPLKHDLTSYGYEVSWKREDQDGSATGAPEAENAVNVTHDQLTRSRMPSTLFGDDFDGRDLEAMIAGLQAETAYSFSVRLVVGEARGAVSGASRRVVTSPCAPPSHIRGVPEVASVEGTCVNLRWLDADDNGGKEIELYLVSSEKLPEKGEEWDLNTGRGAENGAVVREHEKVIAVDASVGKGQVSQERLSSGALWLSTRVCGLFPGAAYTFRVAAMNVLGAGHWSHRSSRNDISPPRRLLTSTESRGKPQAMTATPTLKGVGDPGYTAVSGVDILSQSDLSALIAQDPRRILRASGVQVEDATLPHVVLSDVREQVQVLSSNNSEGVVEVEQTFEAWAGHYSPRLFDVSAELVLADPPDASQPLRNAHAVRDRVLLAVRGGVPFVFKLHHAQRAGALGLVVADANGSCVGGFDQSCVPGADKRRGEGFAAQDRHALWRHAHIPCVLVLKGAARDLLARLGSEAAPDEMAS
ncbi:hypothetical protein PHYPSEUDO_008462 [Phytophthora pseudosyringae]|uniref:Fibronectin type-III domain-containing protein n=1 Tax=Phytophthora pseudosyringae TaxID=221518 RepID=A0A8T1VHB9_9STRA|nr:hypothetical protein PHYPSEUDO_008462 [Phytophthora pseudosyringae]